MDLLQTLKATASKTRDKVKYNLNEVLCIIAMFNEGLTVKQVAEITGRSVNTLRYKFLEGEIELNGKKMIRSVKQFKTIQDLFTHYGEEWVSEDDVKERIADYKKMLEVA